nr:sce7726 family protein [Pseudomonas sp. GM_Psu_2]
MKLWITKRLGHGANDVFIDELCFIEKTRRADVVHANGKLCAFEIKSAADSLYRWESQQEAYLSCFDEVWLCCHSRHVEKALLITDRKVGLLVSDDYGDLVQLRSARKNLAGDKYNLTGFLWREELDGVCKEFGLPVKSAMRIREVRLLVSKALSWDEIMVNVLNALKARYGGQIRSSIDSSSSSAT